MTTIEPSAKAVIVEGGCILLLRYVDTQFGLGTWYSLPGGRQNFGDDLVETLKRECREEISADIAVHELIGVREYIHANHELAGSGRDQHKIEFMFRCTLLSQPSSTDADDDQEGLEWVPLERFGKIKVFPTSLASEVSRYIAPDQAVPSWRDLPQGIYWGDLY